MNVTITCTTTAAGYTLWRGVLQEPISASDLISEYKSMKTSSPTAKPALAVHFW